MNNTTKILVIEDDDDIREMLQIVLENEGYEVSLAKDGRDGLKFFSEEPTDLIITDIFMPDKDGIEIILQIKNNHPDVKIFAISGGGHKVNYDYLDFAKKFGAQYTFKKPFKLEEIVYAVREVFSE